MKRSFTLLRSDYLYHCLFTDESNTPEEKIDQQIEDIIKNEAELWGWAEYEWVKHKIVSDFMRPKIAYYIVEVAEKEREDES
jgi:hypothetical protein